MDSVTVRARRPEDDEFIQALARWAFVRYSPAPGRFVMSILRESPAKAVVAEAGGLPCGFAIVSFEALGRPFGPWARPILASLDAIAVHPDAQRRGIGCALLGEIEQIARRRGALSLSLRTATANTGAQALFRAASFQVVAQIPRFYRGGQDALAMTKLLAT